MHVNDLNHIVAGVSSTTPHIEQLLGIPLLKDNLEHALQKYKTSLCRNCHRLN